MAKTKKAGSPAQTPLADNKSVLTDVFLSALLSGDKERIAPKMISVRVTRVDLESKTVDLEFEVCNERLEPLVVFARVRSICERQSVHLADVHRAFDIRLSSG
jgi:hypothetical protein